MKLDLKKLTDADLAIAGLVMGAAVGLILTWQAFAIGCAISLLSGAALGLYAHARK